MDRIGSDQFAPLHEPPYHAVFISCLQTAGDDAREEFAAQAFGLAARTPGFIGAERSREPAGFGHIALFWADRAGQEDWMQKVTATLRARQRDGDPEICSRYVFRVAIVHECVDLPGEPQARA